jgi:uncharacterized protein (DUF305 family)
VDHASHVNTRRGAGATATLVALLITVLAIGACGGDDGSGDRSAAGGTAPDQAFLEAMIPHHESAVRMANVAKQRGQHGEIDALAVGIVAAQSQEIMQMERIHNRLFGSEITPDPGAHEQLGLSAKEAGMEHIDAAAVLERARPFDRAFIDEMVGHHQGAIRMARAVLSETRDVEIMALAERIDATQSQEITQMNDWRRAWYGAPSPAGGPPKEGKESEMPMEEHRSGHSG